MWSAKESYALSYKIRLLPRFLHVQRLLSWKQLPRQLAQFQSMFESFSMYRVHKKILYAELSPGNRSDGQ